MECTHALHNGYTKMSVEEEGSKVVWTHWPDPLHEGPGVWIVNVSYPCCNHKGRENEVWCALWTDTIFNDRGLPVKCPHCGYLFENTSENVQIVGLA